MTEWENETWAHYFATRVDPATTRECDGYPGLAPAPYAVPAPSWAEMADALEAKRELHELIEGGVQDVTFQEALAQDEEDERELVRYLFGCCGDPGDCGQCGR